MRKTLKHKFLCLTMILGLSTGIMAQDDLLNLLEDEMGPVTEEVVATFKSTRVINCHSIERMQGGDLDFRVGHRFGLLSGGWDEFFGLDESSSKVSLEYGITDWLMAGVGRATVNKTFDGFVKLSALRQKKGEHPFPFSLSLLGTSSIANKDYPDPNYQVEKYQRRSYCAQALIARQFTPGFSLQISPTWLHRNMVKTPSDPNDLYALGVGGRLKLTPRFALSAEYFLVDKKELMSGPKHFNPLSIGIDVETGSHVFQIFVSNTFAMVESDFLAETTRSWKENQLHVGFNITRVFTVIKKKK